MVFILRKKDIPHRYNAHAQLVKNNRKAVDTLNDEENHNNKLRQKLMLLEGGLTLMVQFKLNV